MRRTAVTKINLPDIDFKNRIIRTEEKGGVLHAYEISKEGMSAIEDYLEHERLIDDAHFQSPALFLATLIQAKMSKGGRLHPQIINRIWNQICERAGVSGKTPHSARHGMGKHIMNETGNVAAIQRQLGHKNAAYSLQYARITREELQDVINRRD